MMHTASSLAAWRRCQRLWYYRYLLGYREAIPGVALGFGTAIHYGLEPYWGDKGVKACLAQMVKGDEYRALGPVNQAKTRAMIRGYCQHYGPLDMDVEGVEDTFTFMVDGIVFGGKTDVKAVDRDTGHRVVIDHKTAGRPVVAGDAYTQRLIIDIQATLYPWAYEEDANHPADMLYDILQKPQGKPIYHKRVVKRKAETELQCAVRKAEQLETIPQYEERMVIALTTNGAGYMRHRVLRTHSETRALRDEAMATAKQIQNHSGPHVRNCGACCGKYSDCAYLGVCTGLETLDSDKFAQITDIHPELT